MNLMEKRMVELLTELKEVYHVTGVKAEFEAEGTRMEEAMRLKEVSMKAGLGMNLKIGGCEALKDMFDAMSLGVQRVIAPMVETAYALKKYMGAVKIGCANDLDVEFLINLETETAFNNFDEMLKLPEAKNLSGIVIGRVDLCGSMGLTRNDINSDQVLQIALKIAEKAKAVGLNVVVGGGVSVHSIPFFKKFPEGHIDRFETRKVVFSCPDALNNPKEAFLKSVEFELLWLKNKRNYYATISKEDEVRLEMMENRYRASIEEIYGKQGPA